MATVEKLAAVPMIREREDAADLFVSPAAFEHTQRVAKVFTASALVPQHLRQNVADCILALAIARRMNEDPVSVMQNIYFVGGKAGWMAQYMIARANKAGIFKGPIRWRSTGEGDALEVTAFGTLAETKDEANVTVTMKMAKAEGWTRNTKYSTMPEHMLRWRAATMLIRLYCPEVMMGLPTDVEMQDMAAATMRDVTPAEGSKLAAIIAEDDPAPIDTKPAPSSDPPRSEGAASGAAEADNASAGPERKPVPHIPVPAADASVKAWGNYRGQLVETIKTAPDAAWLAEFQERNQDGLAVLDSEFPPAAKLVREAIQAALAGFGAEG